MTAPIRIAAPSDEDAIVELLRVKHAEDGLAPFDELRVRTTVRKGIDAGPERMAIVGVIRGPQAIEASIGLYISGWWYSNSQHLSDLWTFVAPPYRKSTHAKALLEFAKWASGALGKPLLMHEMLNAQTANKVKLCQRQLGEPDGMLFFYDPADIGTQVSIVA